MTLHCKCMLSALAGLLCIAGCSPPKESIVGANLIVLEGATLIDGTGRAPQENAVIALEGRRILRVGSMGNFDYPPDASVFDVSDRFIVPGFINTHAHVFEEFSPLLLTFGITTVRNPGSGADEGVPGASLGISLRTRLNSGRVAGPRMVTAGRIINNSDVFTPLPEKSNGENGVAGNYVGVRSEDDIRSAVRSQADTGYDFCCPWPVHRC